MSYTGESGVPLPDFGYDAFEEFNSNPYGSIENNPYAQSISGKAPRKVFHKQVIYERVVEVGNGEQFPVGQQQYANGQTYVSNVGYPQDMNQVMYEKPTMMVNPKLVPVQQNIERHFPKPVNIETKVKYEMPQMVPKYKIIKEKIIVPRYIEVAVPTEVVEVDQFAETVVPGPPIKNFASEEWGGNQLMDGTA